MLWLGSTVAEDVDRNDVVYDACLSEVVTS